MNNTLSIQAMAKSKVLPCDVYCDEKVSTHLRKMGIVFKCYFDQEFIRIEHLVQTKESNDTQLIIDYKEIDNIEITLSRIPYGSLYGVRYHITLNFIIYLKDGANYEIESSAFELLECIQEILCNNCVKTRDIIGVYNIICGKSKEEIQLYLNENYDAYLKKYGLTNMRITNDK